MNTYNFSGHIGGSSPLFDITNQHGLEKAKNQLVILIYLAMTIQTYMKVIHQIKFT